MRTSAAKTLLNKRDHPAHPELPADAQAPAFEALSPDLRYRLLQRRKVKGQLFDGVCVAISLALLSPVAVPQLNAALESAISQASGLQHQANRTAAFISPDFAVPVQPGETIAGYAVTSGYGRRDPAELPAGASADHKGVDLATPEGTPIKAIGAPGTKVKVRCWQDSDGGGWVAEIEPDSLPHLRFQALHLSPGSCRTGFHSAGSTIAKTGASGIGAPHLDWRQRDRTTGQHQHPQKAYLLWALSGHAPNANFTRIDRLRNAIIWQESAGDAAIINPDSGALGLAQVMPDNLAGVGQGWDFEALGRDLSASEFLADADAQTQIVNHQLLAIYQRQVQDGYGEEEAIRRTAAEWYSGNPDKADDTAAQYWNGSEYPSIKDYSDDVLNRVQQLRLEQLGEQ